MKKIIKSKCKHVWIFYVQPAYTIPGAYTGTITIPDSFVAPKEIARCNKCLVSKKLAPTEE